MQDEFDIAQRYIDLARSGWKDPSVNPLEMIQTLIDTHVVICEEEAWQAVFGYEDEIDNIESKASAKYEALVEHLQELGHADVWLKWLRSYEKKEKEEKHDMGTPNPETAITRLKNAVEQANAPLIASIAKLTNSIDRLVVVNGAVLKTGIEGLREAAEDQLDELVGEGKGNTPPTPEDFDMESAIKSSGQWECGDIHCNGCPLDQNMDCLQTYGFMDAAENAAGNVNTDDEFRTALHIKLRDVVPVAALTARRPVAQVNFTVPAPEPEAPKPGKVRLGAWGHKDVADTGEAAEANANADEQKAKRKAKVKAPPKSKPKATPPKKPAKGKKGKK